MKKNDQGLAQGLLGKRHSHEAWVSLYTKAIYNLISGFCAGAKGKMQVNVVGRGHRMKTATLIGW